MKSDVGGSGASTGTEVRFQSRESFRLKFQESLREFLARQGSITEGFKLVWDRTLHEIPLPDSLQRSLYWEMVDWARSYELFTNARQVERLRTWRETDRDPTELPI